MKLSRSITSFISLLNASVLLVGTVACNYNPNKNLDGGLNDLIKVIEHSHLKEKDELADIGQNLKRSQRNNFTKIDRSEYLEGKFDNSNPEKAAKWMETNQPTIARVMEKMRVGIESEIKDINAFSKNAYQEKDVEASGYRYALVYYRLQYFKNNLNTILENLSPLSMIIHSPALDEHVASLEFRKSLEKELLRMVGIGIVVTQDLQKVKNTVKVLNESSPLNSSLKDNLLQTDKTLSEAQAEKMKKFGVDRSVCTEKKDEICQRLEANRQKIMGEFQNVSFLYTPGNKYFLITKILTWVGNLTWGLANTMIGAGVVLVAMAVSPFTPYLDFPTFAIASSGMQIYVDVTGMTPFGGKMSLGLFELDNGAGYHFASDHEAGHAIQSAVLGPFYLPTVLVTYLISGFDQGLMEDLAWYSSEVSDVWL